MSKKRLKFPLAIRCGSVSVTIYKVQNRGRPSYTLSYFAEGKRQLKMFADLEEAQAEARSKAVSISKGELDVLHLGNAERMSYVHALDALKPTGMALELAAREYAEAWKILGGKTSILEAAKEFTRRNLHTLPDKMVPQAVKDMLDAKKREGASEIYMKVLRFYLGRLAGAFHCQLRSVTTSQLADFLRDMKGSARSKNNARQTIGAFFKYCRERGWLPKDHDGISMVPKFKQKPSDIQIFKPEEMEIFLAHARPEMVPFLAIGAFAGLRSSEISRLDWIDVHVAERFIVVKALNAKTASRRIVPISENLARWLTPHAQPQGRVVGFKNVNKQIGILVRIAHQALQEAGKEGKTDSTPKTPVRWKKNALRHSYVSYRVADIQNVNQVALECGNSPGVIFKDYRELVRPIAAKQWFAIEPAVGTVSADLRKSTDGPRQAVT